MHVAGFRNGQDAESINKKNKLLLFCFFLPIGSGKCSFYLENKEPAYIRGERGRVGVGALPPADS